MDNIRKTGNFILICLICVLSIKMPVHADNVKVVIDAGHGGENLGAQWDGRDEKAFGVSSSPPFLSQAVIAKASNATSDHIFKLFISRINFYVIFQITSSRHYR